MDEFIKAIGNATENFKIIEKSEKEKDIEKALVFYTSLF